MHSEIKRWGNSAAVRLSRAILAQAGLDIASHINIEVKEGKIVIEAVPTLKPGFQLPFTEAQLIEGMTPHTAHADELAELTENEAGR